MRRVSAEALELLAAYRWPGNVRQLENAVFRAVVLAEGDEVGVAEFPQIAAQSACLRRDRGPGPSTLPPAAAAPERAVPPLLFESDVRSGRHGRRHLLWYRRCADRRDCWPARRARRGAAAGRRSRAEVIRFAIAHYRGQMSEVARRLQIGRSTLYRKLEGLGLGA